MCEREKEREEGGKWKMREREGAAAEREEGVEGERWKGREREIERVSFL